MQIELREYQKQDFKALETINQRNLDIMMILVHQKRRFKLARVF